MPQRKLAEALILDRVRDPVGKHAQGRVEFLQVYFGHWALSPRVVVTQDRGPANSASGLHSSVTTRPTVHASV